MYSKNFDESREVRMKLKNIIVLFFLMGQVQAFNPVMSVSEFWSSIIEPAGVKDYDITLKFYQEELDLIRKIFKRFSLDSAIYTDVKIFKNKLLFKTFLSKNGYFYKNFGELAAEFQIAEKSGHILNEREKWQALINEMRHTIEEYKQFLKPAELQGLKEKQERLEEKFKNAPEAFNDTESELSRELDDLYTELLNEIWLLNPLTNSNIPDALRDTLWTLMTLGAKNGSVEFDKVLEKFFDNIREINKENYMAGHVLVASSSPKNLADVKSFLKEAKIPRQFDPKKCETDAVQIIKCVAAWVDKKGLPPVKDWVVTEDMIKNFSSLAKLFGIAYQKIQSGQDLVAIRDAAQKIALTALKSL